MTKTARSTVPLHPLIAERWSPRGFDREHTLSRAELTALLEAARWSPSASNTQPWRFAVALRGTAEFGAIFATLAAGNQPWASAASGLIVAAAQTAADDGTPMPWAVYDTGQAVAHLSVQAQHEGLAIHQLGGFDAERLATVLELSPEITPLVVLTVGRVDPHAELAEPYASRELAARERRPLQELLLRAADRARSAA
jgi:nitroreductase